jgi:predicted outer membrane lipoprotein
VQTIFTLVHYYPIWALPVALANCQFAIHFMRRRKPAQYLFWLLAAAFFVSTAMWFAYRGDVNGAQWVREHFGSGGSE